MPKWSLTSQMGRRGAAAIVGAVIAIIVRARAVLGFASACLISALLRLRVGDVVIVIGRVGAHIVTIARSIGIVSVGPIAPSDRVVAS